MIKIAGLDDCQDVARGSADGAPLASRAELTFFVDAFETEDAGVAALADFNIPLTRRERAAFPETLPRRLPKSRMIGITGASIATLDLATCASQGVTVCNTAGDGPRSHLATAELALGFLISAARAIPKAGAAMRAGGFQRGASVGVGLAARRSASSARRNEWRRRTPSACTGFFRPEAAALSARGTSAA
jgi:phosphoglycerate dehydrogenase-like enzyme